MSRIVTVQGNIEADALGFCQCHEHLCIAKGYPASVSPGQCIDDEDKSAEELNSYRLAGGRAIVDAQPVGCGRDADFLARISGKSGVNLVASTGFHKMIFYPDNHWIYSYSMEQMAELFVSELREGMYINCDCAPPRERTAHRAGFIKIAFDSCGLTPQYEKLFRAAAQAAVETGAALMAHIEQGASAPALLRFLRKLGVNPERMIFCHMDRAEKNFDLHSEIAESGVYLEYDTISRPKYHSDEYEIELITRILEAGFESRLLMSLDVTRERLASYGGSPGLTYILDKFIPALERAGVSGGQIYGFFVENPARAFSMD